MTEEENKKALTELKEFEYSIRRNERKRINRVVQDHLDSLKEDLIESAEGVGTVTHNLIEQINRGPM